MPFLVGQAGAAAVDMASSAISSAVSGLANMAADAAATFFTHTPICNNGTAPRMKNTIYYQLSISTVNTQSSPLGSWNASTDSNAIRNAPAINAV
jgi:hypothetical protein